MNPSTIYHRPRSEFAFALDDTHYVFRLRTGRGEADSCLFILPTVLPWIRCSRFLSVPWKKYALICILTGTRSV